MTLMGLAPDPLVDRRSQTTGLIVKFIKVTQTNPGDRAVYSVVIQPL